MSREKTLERLRLKRVGLHKAVEAAPIQSSQQAMYHIAEVLNELVILSLETYENVCGETNLKDFTKEEDPIGGTVLSSEE